MICEQRLDGNSGAAITCSAREIGNGDAERVAGFDVVVGCHFVVGENKNSGTGGGGGGLVEIFGGGKEKTAEQHFLGGKKTRKGGGAGAALLSSHRAGGE